MVTSPVSSTPAPVFFGNIASSAWSQNNAEPKFGKTTAVENPRSSAQREMSPTERDEMLLRHMPIVRFVARKIHERLPQHVELEDLIGAGIVGLIDAFNKFDHRKEVQFRSYAQFRIRGAILDSLRSLDWGSRDLRRKGREVEDATQRATQKFGRRPAQSEVAEEMGITLAHYQQILGDLKSLEIGSLNEVHSEDSAEEEMAYVATAPEEDPLFRCLQSEMSSRLSAAIGELPEREARVLKLYYVEELTLKQIGAQLGLAESRISQIRAAAVLTLRSRLQPQVKGMIRSRAFKVNGVQKFGPQRTAGYGANSMRNGGRVAV